MVNLVKNLLIWFVHRYKRQLCIVTVKFLYFKTNKQEIFEKNNQMNKKYYHQPKGLYVLAFIELWDRFTFYGTSALLVLFLTSYYHVSDATASDFYGVYYALGFALPVLGGFAADQFLGLKNSISYGAILIITGNFILAIPNSLFLYFGLSLSLCGIGLVKSSSTALVGTLYSSEDSHRDTGYTLFYMGMNLGAILGPIFYGLMAKTYGWHAGFLMNALLVSIGLIIFRFFFKEPVRQDTQKNRLNLTAIKLKIKKKTMFSFVGILIITSITWLFLNPTVANRIVGMWGLIMLFFMAIIALRRKHQERLQIGTLVVLSLLVIFNFASSLQIGSSLTLFIERYVNRDVFGYTIPTLFFNSLDPTFTIILAPVIAGLWSYLGKINKEPALAIKIFFGLIFTSISFILFSFAAHTNVKNQEIQFTWIMLGNLFLGASELMVVPPMLAAISFLAPKQLLGTLTGMWLSSIALSGYIASVFTKLSASYSQALNDITFIHTFRIIAGIMFILSVLTLFLSPIVRNIMNTTEPNQHFSQ